MVSMNLDELRVVKREMVEMGREAQQVIHPLKVAGVLISMYRLAISYLICRRGDSNEQVFSVLSMCLVGFLFLVVVPQIFLRILVVFRCCYIYRYMLFRGFASCFVATWSCLYLATCLHGFQDTLFTRP